MEVVVVCEFSYKVEYNLENLERKEGIRYFPKINKFSILKEEKEVKFRKKYMKFRSFVLIYCNS